MSGFIAMSRDALDHPLLQDGEHFRAWFWLVAKACWKPTRHDVNGKIVTLERGQFCTSLRQLAAAWGWSKSSVDRFLGRLKSETMIGTDSGTGRLVITICNYDKYQTAPEKDGTPVGTEVGTAAGQQRDTKEQGNKGTRVPSSNDDGLNAAQITKAIFDTGIAILGEAGTAEKQARTMIGMWRKRYGDPAVLAVLGRCPRNLSEPKEWITKALQSEAGNGKRDYQAGKRNGIADALDREIGFSESAGTLERRAIGIGRADGPRAIAGPATG